MSLSEAIQAQLASAWQQMPATAGASRSPCAWQAATTLAFPEPWPPHAGMALTIYAYATGFAPDIADGVQVAAPWGLLHVDPVSETVRFERLSADLVPLGIQGVRPMSPHALQAPAHDGIPALWQAARQGHVEPANAAAIRAAYREWLEGNGVIAASLRPRHEAFFAWLIPDGPG